MGRKRYRIDTLRKVLVRQPAGPEERRKSRRALMDLVAAYADDIAYYSHESRVNALTASEMYTAARKSRQLARVFAELRRREVNE